MVIFGVVEVVERSLLLIFIGEEVVVVILIGVLAEVDNVWGEVDAYDEADE